VENSRPPPKRSIRKAAEDGPICDEIPACVLSSIAVSFRISPDVIIRLGPSDVLQTRPRDKIFSYPSVVTGVNTIAWNRSGRFPYFSDEKLANAIGRSGFPDQVPGQCLTTVTEDDYDLFLRLEAETMTLRLSSARTLRG